MADPNDEAKAKADAEKAAAAEAKAAETKAAKKPRRGTEGTMTNVAPGKVIDAYGKEVK